MSEQKLTQEDEEILEEMKEAGELEPEVKEEDKPAEKPAEKKAEEAEPEEKPKEKAEAEPEEVVERPNKYMPLDQFQDHKKKWQDDISDRDKSNQEKDAIIADLTDKLKSSGSNTDISALASEYSMDEEMLNKLVNTIEKKVALPSDVLAKIEENEQNAKIIEQKNQFEAEFITLDLNTKYPDVTPEKVAEAKKQLHELAHTTRYASYPLEDIIALDKELQETLAPIEKKKTLESGKKPTAKAESSTDERLDNIDDLSDKELDELMDELAKDGKRLTVN